MEQLVVVHPSGAGTYTARAVSVPEVTAQAGTEAEAVDQVKQLLTAWLASAKLFRVDVPVAAQAANPWLETAGRFRDDPQFGDFLEELKRAREADDNE